MRLEFRNHTELTANDEDILKIKLEKYYVNNDINIPMTSIDLAVTIDSYDLSCKWLQRISDGGRIGEIIYNFESGEQILMNCTLAVKRSPTVFSIKGYRDF